MAVAVRSWLCGVSCVVQRRSRSHAGVPAALAIPRAAATDPHSVVHSTASLQEFCHSVVRSTASLQEFCRRASGPAGPDCRLSPDVVTPVCRVRASLSDVCCHALFPSLRSATPVVWRTRGRSIVGPISHGACSAAWHSDGTLRTVLNRRSRAGPDGRPSSFVAQGPGRGFAECLVASASSAHGHVARGARRAALRASQGLRPRAAARSRQRLPRMRSCSHALRGRPAQSER